jgi:hypothetical protein
MLGPRMASVIAAGLLAIGVAGPACADPILEFTGAGIAGRTLGGDVSAGWSFTTNKAVTVVALDALDPTGDGAVGDIPGLSCGRYDLLHRPGHQRQFDAC